ncbi:hypothetical protein B0A55_07070 [Friedmanniomyces simplex]|uniref:Uncharacterized protein n=1 Tax=Friedmanniomyces simplex TaxID=329884 RepID=A0A4U0X555_9PEZI|nr:hypothetical protein B0A55_07070 [Friedmanniomyces simplex]
MSTAPSACLRHQLRQVLLALSSRRLPQRRPLSASTRLHEETTVQAERRPREIRPERDYIYRRIRLDERIIGRPGRRQRQSSEQLATASLGRPSEVVVLRDVIEQPIRRLAFNAERNGARPLTEKAPDLTVITSGLEKGLASEEEEVNASIEGLRPENAVVDKQTLRRLEEQLLERYNLQQLVKYSVQLSSPVSHAETAVAEVASSTNRIRVTSWQPGRTPMEHRVGRVTLGKRELGKSKANVARKILQSAWSLTTDTESQQLGELEVYLRPWQLALMFDVKRNGVAAIETLIDSPLLFRSSDVQARREENVVRITARKGDAEEIVRRVEQKLARVTREELDLTVFAPLLKNPGWPSTHAELFSKDDLDYVTGRTQSVFENEDDGKLAIYSIADRTSDSAHARRLLLSLLDLPSPTHRLETGIIDERRETNLPKSYLRSFPKLGLLAFPVMDAHRRHRSVEWCRLAVTVAKPTKRRDGSRIAEDMRMAQKFADYHKVSWLPWWRRVIKRTSHTLRGTESAARGAVSDCAGWVEDSHPEWTVRFGALLHPEQDFADSAGSMGLDEEGLRKESAQFHNQCTGLLPLLSNFMANRIAVPSNSETPANGTLSQPTPTSADRRLLVHLTPSPSTQDGVEALRSLPRITMDFSLSDAIQSDRPRESVPHLSSVVATWNRQEFDLAFPAQTADLSFARESTMSLSKEAWSSNGQINEVVRNLRDSVDSKTGGLPAMAHVGITLPRFTTQSSPAERGITDSGSVSGETVPYYISHYEHVTSVDYVPLRDEARLARMEKGVRTLAEQWPESMVLRCSDVNGGAFGGRWTEAKLLRLPEDARAVVRDENAAAVEKSDSVEESNAVTGADESRKTRRAELELVDTAMTLLRLMTRANAGELRSPYDASAVDEVEMEME